MHGVKHYVLVVLDSSAPSEHHESLVQGIANEIHLKFGVGARCFRVDAGSACAAMHMEARNELVTETMLARRKARTR